MAVVRRTGGTTAKVGTKKNATLGVVFGLLFGLVGMGVLVYGIMNLNRGRASESWPTVSGVVTHSDVRSSRGDSSTTYHAEVSYEFVVEGAKHHSDKVSFGEYGTNSHARAARICDGYPVGAPVDVFYSPEDPDVAVLEPGASGFGFFLPIILGGVFNIVGGVAFFVSVVGLSKLRIAEGAKPPAAEAADDDNPYRADG
jgi:hypothetical protein